MSQDQSIRPKRSSQVADDQRLAERIEKLQRIELIGMGKVLREIVAALTSVEQAMNEWLEPPNTTYQPMDELVAEMREVRLRMLNKFRR